MAVSTISQAGLDSPITLTNPVISSIVNTGTLTLPTTTGTLALQSDVIGIGQTWQLLTGSRAIGTTYTNSTGRPIMVAAVFTNSSTNQTVGFTVSGVNVVFDQTTTANTGAGGTLIIPNGATYVTYTSAGTLTLVSWSELR
jgi:hypothetical protein